MNTERMTTEEIDEIVLTGRQINPEWHPSDRAKIVRRRTGDAYAAIREFNR